MFFLQRPYYERRNNQWNVEQDQLCAVVVQLDLQVSRIFGLHLNCELDWWVHVFHAGIDFRQLIVSHDKNHFYEKVSDVAQKNKFY